MRPYKLGSTWIDLDHVQIISEAQKPYPNAAYSAADATLARYWTCQILFAFQNGYRRFRLGESEAQSYAAHVELMKAWQESKSRERELLDRIHAIAAGPYPVPNSPDKVGESLILMCSAIDRIVELAKNEP